MSTGPLDFDNAMCQFCDKMFVNDSNVSQNKGQYYEHARQEHRLAVKLSWKQCKECEVFVPDQNGLEKHMFDCHSNNNLQSAVKLRPSLWILCQFCDKLFDKSIEKELYYKPNIIH
jgi:hypothetical protein